MIRIMFVCHGNICRSTMAEFVMKDMIKKEGLSDKVYVASSATSREEIGNPVHYGTRNKLREHGISTDGKYAVQLTKNDYKEYDYILGMDSYNIRNILRITDGDPEGKVSKLLDLTSGRDIADPWYTGNFDETYDDVVEGCEALLKKIQEKIDK
ncbi:MAG: low molecular weight phosphotyrosine protein phosphatase [Ruminococcaceae bacterium]|nr:low molecular weight phosphotyrosine protein phosphatase [Oscillospiraceae bacterium]